MDRAAAEIRLFKKNIFYICFIQMHQSQQSAILGGTDENIKLPKKLLFIKILQRYLFYIYQDQG